MAFLRDNLWAFVGLIALVAASMAYAFSAFVEKRDKADDAAPKKSAIKTAVFVAIAGGILMWFTRQENATTAPFQE